MTNFSYELLRKLLDKMPTFPASVTKILQMMDRPDITYEQIENVAKFDPIITVKILSLVNSAHFGLRNRVTSINHAISLLGIRKTRNLLISIATIGSLPRIQSVGKFNLNTFLIHSLGTAVISRILAKELKISPTDPEEYFISGLLHDFGKIVMIFYKPDQYKYAINASERKKAKLYKQEEIFFGKNHAFIGFALSRHWKLSGFIESAIHYHHNVDYIAEKYLIDVAIIHAANCIANQHEIGVSGDYGSSKIDPRIADMLKLNVDDLPEILAGLDEEVDKAKVFLNIL